MLKQIIDLVSILITNANKNKNSRKDHYQHIPEDQPFLPEKVDEVNITIDKRVRDKYRKGWIKKVRKDNIIEITLHGTAGSSSTDGLLRWMYQGARAKQYYKGVALFHYAIGRKDYKIVEVIDPDYWVYHSSSGKHDKKTIGIELLNPSKTNRDPYTDEQYGLLFDLIFEYLIPNYPTITQISSHDYNRIVYSGLSKKGCPGNFDWDKLSKELDARGYSYKIDGNLHYDIKKKSETSNQPTKESKEA